MANTPRSEIVEDDVPARPYNSVMWTLRLTKASMLLLLGAIVNVMVAWGFAAFWRLESNVGLTEYSISQPEAFKLAPQ